MLAKHEGTEYLYVFHELDIHKQGLDNKYAISKTYYFQNEEQFYKQQEMLQDDLEALGIKDKSSALNHIGKLNKEQLELAKAKTSELKSIQNSAPNSNMISGLIEFHDEVIGLLLEWFNKMIKIVKGTEDTTSEIETLNNDWIKCTSHKIIKKHKAKDTL